MTFTLEFQHVPVLLHHQLSNVTGYPGAIEVDGYNVCGYGHVDGAQTSRRYLESRFSVD